MKTRTVLPCLILIIAALSIAAPTKSPSRLTPQRVAELTAPAPEKAAMIYEVTIAGFPKAALKAEQRAVIETVREVIYPTEFDPPHTPQTFGASLTPITPTTPTVFETLQAGWSIKLLLKPRGKVVEVIGSADFTTADHINGGYGALAGPIFSEKGEVLTPNKLDLPRTQTTTTRFHIFAVPGEPYEVTFYQGSKAEKRTITVAAQ